MNGPIFPCEERIGARESCALDRGHTGRHRSAHTPLGRDAEIQRMLNGIPAPENPDRLQGPEVGTTWLYKGEPVTIKERSYVWSPEKQQPSGYWGFRQYHLKVIQRERGTLLVDDKDLVPA